jgi:hypothetical protein
VGLSWIIVSGINLVSSHEEHARQCCEVVSQVQDPLMVWRGFSDLSEVGLICSSTEEEERGSPLKVCGVDVEREKNVSGDSGRRDFAGIFPRTIIGIVNRMEING